MSSLAQVMQLESRRATTKSQAFKSLNFSQETTVLPQLVQLLQPPEANPSSLSWRVNHSRIKHLPCSLSPGYREKSSSRSRVWLSFKKDDGDNRGSCSKNCRSHRKPIFQNKKVLDFCNKQSAIQVISFYSAFMVVQISILAPPSHPIWLK